MGIFQTIQDLHVLPFDINDVEERISSFKKLNDDVRQVIPDLMLAVMNILFDQYQKLKETEYVPSMSTTAVNQVI